MEFSKRKAIIAGTFDPPTHGHMYLVTEASRLFDTVYWLVAVNKEKTPLLDFQTRMQLMRQCVEYYQMENVLVVSTEGLVVEYAKQVGASYLVRSARNSFDFEYERKMANFNSKLCSWMRTIFIHPPEHYSEISSTEVRELLRLGYERLLYQYVPDVIDKYLQEKYGQKQCNSL